MINLFNTALMTNSPRARKLMIALFIVLMLSMILMMSTGVVAAGSATSGSYCAC